MEGYGAFGLVVTLAWLYLELHLESRGCGCSQSCAASPVSGPV